MTAKKPEQRTSTVTLVMHQSLVVGAYASNDDAVRVARKLGPGYAVTATAYIHTSSDPKKCDCPQCRHMTDRPFRKKDDR